MHIVPGDGTYSSCVALVGVDDGLLDTIPKLYLAGVGADGEGVACGVEVGACDHVLIAYIH